VQDYIEQGLTMRLALLSDIHGNYTALEAVLNDIQQQQIDSVICLGDVATMGPQPKQVIAALQKLGCPCIMGNHDAATLQPEHAPQYRIAPPLTSTLQWCADQLDVDETNYLRSFKSTLEIPLEANTTLLCFHGSPRSNIENIFATTPPDDLDKMLADHTANIFACGHTHLQMLRQHKGNLIVNAGSIGHPFRQTPVSGTPPTLLPWAEYAIVNSTQESLSVDLRRVFFDFKNFAESISKSNFPLKEWWLKQYSI
jgi:putative phosphoesterase